MACSYAQSQPLAGAGPAEPPSYAETVAGIEKTPGTALELVRSRVAFRPYSGFVKGPQATWRDGTANAGDAAELLLDVLRRKKIPVRLAFGTLPAERVDALLGSLPSPKPPEEVQKSLTGTPSPGPARDAALRKSVARHVWVQARSDGKWVDLDAIIPGLAVGEAPAPVEKTLAGLNSTYILSYISTLNNYAFTRVNLTGNPKYSEEQIHQKAIEAASSFDWFGAYLELFSAAMASATWNPKATAFATAGGVLMLAGGQHNALEFIRSQYSPPTDPQNP